LLRRGLVKGVPALNAPHLKSIRERGRLIKKERKAAESAYLMGGLLAQYIDWF
jgi:hypothetical protein